ncbi:MAG: phosphoglycerate kinase [Acidobacteria bacterium]|nr:MAG: phosphoglycerate kinase [Acidobacteriota bacterium]
MAKLSVRQLAVEQRLVLTRVDFNVPLEGERVLDNSRIVATLPTLRLLMEREARIVLCSHMGRPKGKRDERYSLRPLVARLEHLLEHSVGFCPETVGPLAQEMAARLEPGNLLLLENLRFQPGEEANDDAFSRQLAALGEAYVDDAFGAAHRAHASIVGVTQYFPQAAAGLLMQSELDYLGRLLHADEHPYVVLLGGAKVSDKLPLIAHLAQRADRMLIGGGMAYTFLRALGQPTGDSLVQEDFVEPCRKLLADFPKGHFVLPIDHVLSSQEVVTTIPEHTKAMDIGPSTRAKFAEYIRPARLLFWNGPMGVFEQPPLDAGTIAVARAVADCHGITVAGGGDSIAALRQAGLKDALTHVSTGGGASLEFLAGDPLPGVEALTEV